MFEIPGLQTASNDLRGQPITSDLKFVFRGLNNLCSSASPAPIVLYLTNLPGKKERPIIIPRAAYSYLVAAKKGFFSRTRKEGQFAVKWQQNDRPERESIGNGDIKFRRASKRVRARM